jgi:drug/metabolite transporter (DMT)-like permease
VNWTRWEFAAARRNECVLIGSMAETGLRGWKKEAGPIAALLLLCLLWSLSSLRSDLLPQLAPTTNPQLQFERQALSLGMLALTASLLSLAQRREWPRGTQIWSCSLVGLGLFVAPMVLVYFARNWVADSARVVLFSLAPVFAVVIEPYFGRFSSSQIKGGLMAAIVAVVGTLFVFPIDLPQSVEAGFGFCAVVLAAGCAASANCWAVRVACELPGESIAPFAAIAGATSSITFLASSLLTNHRLPWNWNAGGPGVPWSSAWSAAVELPGLLLLFWLMRRMSAARMMTRFLLAPLMANLIGLLVLRPAVSLRDGLGLVLVSLGAGWLLFAREVEPETNGSTLKLDAR